MSTEKPTKTVNLLYREEKCPKTLQTWLDEPRFRKNNGGRKLALAEVWCVSAIWKSEGVKNGNWHSSGLHQVELWFWHQWHYKR